MKKKFSVFELKIITECIEASAWAVDEDCPRGEWCECDDYFICLHCRDLEQQVSILLKSHNYAHGYDRDTGLSCAARSCAERIYLAYCRRVGRQPIGCTL